MSSNSTFEKVASLIAASTPLSPSDISEESELAKDLGLSSLEQVMLSAQVESTFSIKLEENDTADISTVGDLVSVVDRLRGA